MSIFKETFKPGVQDQIVARQNAILNRDVSAMHYYNSRNAWIKMTSGVNVGGTNELAKKYILQGGILDPNNKLRSGLGQDGAYSNISPSGSLYRLGIRPMPGITSIDVKSKSAYGSLREVTVKFQAWDIKQLEDLELLYMRPGYTALVEWGWSPYLNNSGSLQTTVNYTDVDILNKSAPATTKEDIWKAIYTKSSTDGNYDAVYGFIKNYGWEARNDGGYDCTTTIITMGEILESLKINYGTSETNAIQKGILGYLKPEAFESENYAAVKAYSENILAGVIVEAYLGMIPGLWSNLDDKHLPENYGSSYRSGYNWGTLDFFRWDLNIANSSLKKTILDYDTQIYIRLRDFVDILNNTVLLQDSGQKNPKAIVQISVQDGDIHQSGEDLLCLSHPLQLSTNPAVCLIKNYKWTYPSFYFGVKADSEALTNVMDGLSSEYFKPTPSGELGIIGNIYVNLGYLYSLATNPELESKDKKEKNDIAIFDYLKNMLGGINTALGNVANLDIYVDPVDSIARIIDVNYVDTKKRQDVYDSAFTIEMQNTKSTVRSYKLASQIFPEQSTQVAIGAQTKGGPLAAETNTLIDFNKGLEDRIVPKREAPFRTTNSNPITEAEHKIKNLKNSLETISKYTFELNENDYIVFSTNGNYDLKEASKYANALKDIISFFKSLTPNDNKNRAIIPTKLSIEMDGIGGLIIGNIFKIPDDLLPRGYKGGGAGPEKIAYIVTGIGHSIHDSDWKTHVDAQFIILDDPTGIYDEQAAFRIAADITYNVSNNNVLTAANQLTNQQPTANTLSKTAAFGNIAYPYPNNGQFKVSSPYHKNRKTGQHRGVDIQMPVGTPIYAVEDGTVVGPTFEAGGAGNYVHIKHTHTLLGYDTLSMHLSQVNVKTGQQVKKGDLIGLSGGKPGLASSGHSTNPHLHFETRFSSTQDETAPSDFFKGL
jgi:murein DD-endopeptidase MepM/ murein hydrolase activator NlpD